jgi:hypothetical protein
MQKDNVIELPVKHPLLKLKNTLRLRFDLEQRKVLASASILSILFIVAVVNDRMMSHPETVQQNSRSIASYGEVGPAIRDQEWENQLAHDLSLASHTAGSATFAAPATPLDQLTYGTLEGKYSMQVFRGHVQQIEFANNETSTNPVLVQDRARFLMQNRELLPVQYASLIKTGTQLSGTEMNEQFALLDAQQKTLAKVEFHLDSFGRLLSMKINL